MNTKNKKKTHTQKKPTEKKTKQTNKTITTKYEQRKKERKVVMLTCKVQCQYNVILTKASNTKHVVYC